MRRRLLGGHVWLAATWIPLLVELFPLEGLVRVLTPPKTVRPYAGVPVELICQCVSHRLRRPRNMRRRACLRHGLVLYHFLKLAGYPAELQVGVFSPHADPLRMHAHCWVTLDGVALSPPPEEPVMIVPLTRG